MDAACKQKKNMTYIVLCREKMRDGRRRKLRDAIQAYTLREWCQKANRNYNTVFGRIVRAGIAENQRSVIFIREDSELLSPANKNTLEPLIGVFHDKANSRLEQDELNLIASEH